MKASTRATALRRALWLWLLLLAPPGCAGPLPGEPPSATPLLLDPGHPAVERVGRLRWLGGLELRDASPDFGGVSGLTALPGEGRLLGLTDRAHWLSLRPLRDAAGHLTGIADLRLSPLLDESGRPLGTAGHRGDSESLERLPGGGFAVGFERRHRIWRYAATDAPAVPVAAPKGLRAAPFNGGLEAMTLLPDGRWFLLAEQLRDAAGDLVGWVGRPGAWSRLTWRATAAYEPSDLTLGPDGQVYVLERRFSYVGGFGARISRLPAAAIRPGPPLEGEEVARLEAPLVTENFEGLAALADADGSTLLYLVSDDNFFDLQRTLLLLFRVEE